MPVQVDSHHAVGGMSRKVFLAKVGLCLSGIALGSSWSFGKELKDPFFNIKPIGRSLSFADYYVWCSSPIWGDNGKVHLFYSRWPKSRGMSGWINGSEVCRAEAESPYATFEHKEVVIKPNRDGSWDSTSCHNPLIVRAEDKYFLFYMGNSNGKTNTKRIGLAMSDSLEGPWKRPESPCLLPGQEGQWDDHCTTNPAFVKGNDGKYWLFYKSWNTSEYESQSGAVRGNRKYGLAKADHPEGPYMKVGNSPIIDFSDLPDNAQLEDAFVWKQQSKYYMVARDMGFYNHEYGLVLSSEDGLDWSKPKVSYLNMANYVTEPAAPGHLKRFGRLERPMLLLDRYDGETPRFLFGATQGGDALTSTTYVFEIIN